MSLNHSDEEETRKGETGADVESTTAETEEAVEVRSSEEEQQKAATLSSPSAEAKDNNNSEQVTEAQTVEQIVGHILKQNQEFQKLLEKQRTNSIINVRQQRFNKRITAAAADTSDESDAENSNYIAGSTNHSHNNHDNGSSNNNNRLGRARATHREQRLIRTNNAWNSLSSTRENAPLQLLYDNLKTSQKSTESSILARNAKTNHVHEKRALFEAFKRQSIVTDSKVIKTALRIRENSTSSGGDVAELSTTTTYDSNHAAARLEPRKELNTPATVTAEHDDGEKNDDGKDAPRDTDSKGFGNYDNLQHVWEGLQTEKDVDGNDSPTQPAVWLTKLCEGLPTSPPKCGSLPRSFQISPNSQQPSVTKSRFLQRDGKPMSERPFTIASDKPAEINLEDMERYASTCQPEGRIAKFPMPASTSSSSSSTFFCSMEDATLSDADVRANGASIHPDHKIYRANGGSAIFKNVLSKAGSRLQGLRNTLSTETLEYSDELDRTRYFPSLSVGKCQLKRRNKSKHAKESSSDVEELVGCTGAFDQRVPMLYYKQGSSSLGARIAQSDYADPTILFAESKRNQSVSSEGVDQFKKTESDERDREEQEPCDDKDTRERRESETDSFYERCFETIENYVDADADEAFRDSAIFSDVDEVFVAQQPIATTTPSAKAKVAPPIPAKKKQETSSLMSKYKPNVAQKPDYLRVKSLLAKGNAIGEPEVIVDNATARLSPVIGYQSADPRDACNRDLANADDVSAGQSQAGWVRKIVGQLQGHVET